MMMGTTLLIFSIWSKTTYTKEKQNDTNNLDSWKKQNKTKNP